MVSFEKLISPRSRKHLDSLREEMVRAAGMDRKELASWVLGLARALQDSGALNADQRYSYDEWGAYRVMPELARRLDPDLVLREEEIPKEEERSDLVTWLVDAPDSRLAECVNSLIGNASWMRVMKGEDCPESSRRAAALFYYCGGANCNPLAIGLAALIPGSVDLRIEPPKHRDPFPGLFVIAESGRHDRVVAHCESAPEAEAIFDHVDRILAGEKIESYDSALGEKARRLLDDMQYFGRDPRGIRKAEVLSIQDCDGKVLRSVAIDKPAEIEPGF